MVHYLDHEYGIIYTDSKGTIHISDGEIIDWYGPDVEMSRVEDPTKDHVTVWVSSNAMEHWVMQ